MASFAHVRLCYFLSACLTAEQECFSNDNISGVVCGLCTGPYNINLTAIEVLLLSCSGLLLAGPLYSSREFATTAAPQCSALNWKAGSGDFLKN